jgi:hypothetical protein
MTSTRKKGMELLATLASADFGLLGECRDDEGND